MLVVDDDPAMRVRLGETLEREGFAVTVEETGEAVMAAVERTRFDAVVLDKELPDINGLDLVFFLRHRCPGTPVVLIAAHGGELSAAAGRVSIPMNLLEPILTRSPRTVRAERRRTPAVAQHVSACRRGA